MINFSLDGDSSKSNNERKFDLNKLLQKTEDKFSGNDCLGIFEHELDYINLNFLMLNYI